MNDLFTYVGLAVCAAVSVAAAAGFWWFALRVVWEAIRNTAVMAVFVRWWMIKYIRSVRREKRKAVARHVEHTQRVTP